MRQRVAEELGRMLDHDDRLVVMLAAMGLVMNISRQAGKPVLS